MLAGVFLAGIRLRELSLLLERSSSVDAEGDRPVTIRTEMRLWAGRCLRSAAPEVVPSTDLAYSKHRKSTNPRRPSSCDGRAGATCLENERAVPKHKQATRKGALASPLFSVFCPLVDPQFVLLHPAVLSCTILSRLSANHFRSLYRTSL